MYVIHEVDDLEADEEKVFLIGDDVEEVTVHGTEHEYTEVDFIGAEVDSHKPEVRAAEPEIPYDVEP